MNTKEIFDIHKELSTGKYTYEEQKKVEERLAKIVHENYLEYVKIVDDYLNSLFETFGKFNYNHHTIQYYINDLRNGAKVYNVFLIDEQELIDGTIRKPSISIYLDAGYDRFGFDIPQEIFFGTKDVIEKYVYDSIVESIEDEMDEIKSLENKIKTLIQSVKNKSKLCSI